MTDLRKFLAPFTTRYHDGVPFHLLPVLSVVVMDNGSVRVEVKEPNEDPTKHASVIAFMHVPVFHSRSCKLTDRKGGR